MTRVVQGTALPAQQHERRREGGGMVQRKVCVLVLATNEDVGMREGASDPLKRSGTTQAI
jgi:hypothetical protein